MMHQINGVKWQGSCVLHLGFGIYLGPSVQQQSDHDHIPPPGCNVQWSDTILQRKTDALIQREETVVIEIHFVL